MGIKILQILLVLIILEVIFLLFRLYRALKLEKRLASFAITSLKDNDVSILDFFSNYIDNLILKTSKILKKSEVLRKYGEKYNRFIDYNDKNKKEGINYVASKFLLSFSVLILSLITMMFHKIDLNMLFFLTIFLISFFIPDIYLNIEFNSRRKNIEKDLLKAIIIMNNAFQSGRNIMQAVECVKKELEGPIKSEFEKIYLDITYGLSLDVVFSRFYERVKLEDAKYITTSLTLLNKTGGDIIKVFSLIEKSIFDKKSLRNELQSLTASSTLVFKMLVILPFIMIGVIFILNPKYFNPLFQNPLGIIFLLFTILLYIMYILVIKRIMQVEV